MERAHVAFECRNPDVPAGRSGAGGWWFIRRGLSGGTKTRVPGRFRKLRWMRAKMPPSLPAENSWRRGDLTTRACRCFLGLVAWSWKVAIERSRAVQIGRPSLRSPARTGVLEFDSDELHGRLFFCNRDRLADFLASECGEKLPGKRCGRPRACCRADNFVDRAAASI